MMQINGREMAFLMGHEDDDGNEQPSRVVHLEITGVRNGYEEVVVVAKHPNGKLIKFIYRHDSEHGITECKEHPDKMFDAVEVEPVETVTITYREKK